ncbi:hypothetical protein BpHYR1_053621 [Brachionus plicatilis]|uniref:Uncharacterized protein n=1 Tax=Brachionus plicatilis TaxID=10195 RepID=A0A3M7PIB8_BRAPC|nr:hypothetical protein BpHYR1_053621 [Brachionus plicatilis]
MPYPISPVFRTKKSNSTTESSGIVRTSSHLYAIDFMGIFVFSLICKARKKVASEVSSVSKYFLLEIKEILKLFTYRLAEINNQ